MSITKSGIWTSSNFQESGIAIYSDSTIIGDYAPTKDGTNSCLNNQGIDLSTIGTVPGHDVKIRIELDLYWSGGFAASSTAGTFAMSFQGSNYKIADSAYKWEGTNYITSALNSQQSPKTTVLSATTGVYHYNCLTTIPASWFATYSGSNLGLRTDYANNGTARVGIKNVRIYPDEYYSAGTAHIHNNYTAGYQFIEY